MESLVSTIANKLIPSGQGVISVTGAGGKTTLLVSLGRYLRDKGLSVLLTTTTKIQSPKTYDFETDEIFTDETAVLQYEVEKGKSVFYAQKALMDPKKMISPRPEVLSLLIKRFDAVLIEADGSRQLPLKYHTQRDPVILPETSATVAVMGASAWGECIDNVCFGFESTRKVDDAFISFLINDAEGAFKRAQGDCLLLINQADIFQPDIRSLECTYPVILGSLKEDRVYAKALC